MPIPGLNEPFPSRDRIVEKDGHPSYLFTNWNERVLLARLQASPVLAETPTVLVDQAAAAAGDLAVNVSGGFYRVEVFSALSVADAVANSLQLTLSWTLNGHAYTETFAALTSLVVGAAGSRQSAVFVMQVDPNTAVSYSFAYVSNTPGAMRWQTAATLTLIQAIGV